MPGLHKRGNKIEREIIYRKIIDGVEIEIAVKESETAKETVKNKLLKQMQNDLHEGCLFKGEIYEQTAFS